MIETPQELGLPPKFTEWRDGQAEAIEAITRSRRTIFLLDAPTGVGKTALAMGAYATITLPDQVMAWMQHNDTERDYRCIYVTRTKQLQRQILNDFPKAKTIRGRNNYPCLLRQRDFPSFSAEHCVHTRDNPCKAVGDCPYLLEKEAAVNADMAVLNEAYYLSEINGPGQFSGANMVILDECDNVENALMSFIQMEISQKQLERYDLKPPERREDLSAWVTWAQNAIGQLNRHYQVATEQLPLVVEYWTNQDIELQKSNKHLSTFIHKMEGFIDDLLWGDKNWVNWVIKEFEDKAGGWQIIFKPVQVANFANRYLWKHGERFLGMSGTILDPKIMSTDLGMNVRFRSIEESLAEVPIMNHPSRSMMLHSDLTPDYMRLDSPFPVENRPIFYKPEVDLNRDSMKIELPRLAIAIAGLLNKYPDDRVLVHTVSYTIRDYLMAHLPPERLVTHDTANREEMLEWFYHETSGRAAMVSPSFDRGVDLFGDRCRCVIVCKMPYLDLSDKQVKARMEMADGRRWYALKAIQTLMQMTGRHVRSKTDHGDTWILDRSFDRLLNQTRYCIPAWWLNSIRRV